MNVTIGIAYVLCGLMIFGLCYPLAKNKIKPNRWYGFRFREAFMNDEAWYRINAYGARRMLPWAMFLLIVGLVPLVYGLEAPGRPMVCNCLTWVPAVLIFPVLQSWLFAKSLRNEMEA